MNSRGRTVRYKCNGVIDPEALGHVIDQEEDATRTHIYALKVYWHDIRVTSWTPPELVEFAD